MRIQTTYPVITADDAIEQGTGYGNLLSIAGYLERQSYERETIYHVTGRQQRLQAQAVRLVAMEVARRQGVQLYGSRPANHNTRQRAKRRAA